MKKLLLILIPFFLFSCLDSNDNIDNSADIAFLEENSQRDDVTVTDSGLQYRVLQESEGEQPGPNDTVVVHYRGELISGDVFDSSFAREEPATFSLDGVIAGFSEGIQLMRVGSVFELVLPAELAYGNNPPFGSIIYRGATLIFEVQLIEIVTGDEEETEE
jgi:FKBP-type peptidyl-prolyl cis-trans isomerase